MDLGCLFYGGRCLKLKELLTRYNHGVKDATGLSCVHHMLQCKLPPFQNGISPHCRCLQRLSCVSCRIELGTHIAPQTLEPLISSNPSHPQEASLVSFSSLGCEDRCLVQIEASQ
uniref:Uncharacterized protein n=1 Tax=Opuntia streptacantha TaxID=393608 RepID=A0A7C9DPB6_OPUST